VRRVAPHPVLGLLQTRARSRASLERAEPLAAVAVFADDPAPSARRGPCPWGCARAQRRCGSRVPARIQRKRRRSPSACSASGSTMIRLRAVGLECLEDTLCRSPTPPRRPRWRSRRLPLDGPRRTGGARDALKIHASCAAACPCASGFERRGTQPVSISSSSPGAPRAPGIVGAVTGPNSSSSTANRDAASSIGILDADAGEQLARHLREEDPLRGAPRSVALRCASQRAHASPCGRPDGGRSFATTAGSSSYGERRRALRRGTSPTLSATAT